MIARAIAADVPFARVAADSVYGVGDIDQAQYRRRRSGVLHDLVPGGNVLVSVAGHRWAIEDSFETAKNELGLDHNETRPWHGWHRHVSLVMLAFAMLAAIRSKANQATPPKRLRKPPRR